MPMPKLLKKLSRRSLRGHDSEAETDSESPPPLPPAEYDSHLEDSPRSFTPPLKRFGSAGNSSATSSPRPSGDWSHQVMRSTSTGTVSTGSPSVNSRQTSQNVNPDSRISYAPPSGSPPARSRATSYGSRPASAAMESDPRARVYSPSQLGYHLPMNGNPATPSPGVQGVQQPWPQAPNDDLSRDLAGAWEIANTAPKVSKVDQVLLVAENNIMQAQVKEGKAAAFATGVAAGLTAVGGMEVIEHGLNTFMEGIPVLMNALDEVAKLHPFIGVAVMAFKAVWALEMKRRANDKMILSLHMEMKDMMGVLTQLKNVKDSEEVAPDGSTIRGRMQEIVKGTADDIKACANTCDTYTKKKLVVKILKGPVWEGKLVAFVGKFTKRRGEFEFALSIHTALGVDAANRAITAVDKTTQEMNAKMDMMMKMFQTFVSPEQKEMARLVEQKGGIQACQENDKVLRELDDLENKSSAAHLQQGPTSTKGAASTSGLDDLKDELMTDVDAAIQKNLTVFSRKLEVQTRQIIDELSKVVERQGDRVISAITAGPHDRIVDADVHKVWKEMGWRGSVKSRHFVMALRDYYQEGGADSATKTEQPHEDDWALDYLNVSRLQPISEAFDDDASGFVTVAEANTFTASRPLEWSLKKWLAFWAIGWHQSMARYVVKIQELLAKMFALRLHVLPANRGSVNKYLDSIYNGVTTLHSGLNACYINESLQEKFHSYVEAEEARLRGNLEAISYDIDALNTLYLISGQGRIERFLLPLIFLLLERDLKILRTCQTKVVSHEELWDAADTLKWTVMAARERVDLLESTFKQQKVDMKQQFKTFAHGLFQYMHDPEGLWAPALVLAQDDIEYPYDENLEPEIRDDDKILNYPPGTDRLDFDAYTPVPRAKKVATRPAPALRALLGTWNGFTYSQRDGTVPSSGMLSFDLSATGNLTFGASAQRANMSEFSISGECSAHHLDIVNFSFKQTFPTRFSPVYFTGSWVSSTESLSGTWGEASDPRTHSGVFIFKRTPPECMCFFPPPAVLKQNNSKALWQFSIAAVRYGVRRGTWSWSFFEQRAKSRKRFVELYIRSTRFGRPLTRNEEEELGLLKKSFTTADSRFYHSIAEHQIRETTDHDVSCDLCKGHIGGSRITCLTCRLEGTFDTVDFCDNQTCASAKVIPTGLTRPHLPTHDILKVRRVVHIRQFGKTYRQAHEALKRAREFFPDPEDEMAETPKAISEAPRCAVCRRAATQPCWFCVQCEEPSFICVACEGKKKYSFVGHDMDTHDLVRCSVLVETAEVVLEERLADIETRLGKHEAHIDDKLASMELKMGERLSQLDQKMSDIESLLRELVYTMGARTKPSSTLPAYPHTSINTAPSYIDSYPYSQ
ncbi:hypothetical protein DFH08DRAFT_33383 [Mycena albidolilacea]|uniref:Vacuolar protein sorting-associated protein 13 second N-terminal domain-containing protein n=1 Tax=Mycena albidolilacea TaxID=1033008 RepID=A0AAD7F4Q4_9AGAR|nr:hypothetical protein DFH08DRAFT_33383 [Mycena albidolilacea]